MMFSRVPARFYYRPSSTILARSFTSAAAEQRPLQQHFTPQTVQHLDETQSDEFDPTGLQSWSTTSSTTTGLTTSSTLPAEEDLVAAFHSGIIAPNKTTSSTTSFDVGSLLPEALRSNIVPTVVVDSSAVQGEVFIHKYLLPKNAAAYDEVSTEKTSAEDESISGGNFANPMVLHLKKYTEKSIVVSGDTKEHKDTLKSIGGKWNKTAGGWLFPSSQKDTVLEKLEDIEDELKNELGDDAEGPPKKKAKLEKEEDKKEANDKVVDLDDKGRKKVSCNVFKGKTLVDVREFYQAGGEMKPTPKGISLSVELYKKFVEKADEMKDAIGEQKAISIDLGNNRRLTLSEFKNNWYVGIREYWQADDGEMKPGKKGVSLSIDAFNKLVESDETIQGWIGE